MRPIEKIPVIPIEVLDYFKRILPPRQPKVDDPERMIWIRVGHQEVIAKMEHLFDQQQKDPHT